MIVRSVVFDVDVLREVMIWWVQWIYDLYMIILTCIIFWDLADGLCDTGVSPHSTRKCWPSKHKHYSSFTYNLIHSKSKVSLKFLLNTKYSIAPIIRPCENRNSLDNIENKRILHIDCNVKEKPVTPLLYSSCNRSSNCTCCQ